MAVLVALEPVVRQRVTRARNAGFISWWPEGRDREEETDGPNPIQEHTSSDLTSSQFHNPLKALQASALW